MNYQMLKTILDSLVSNFKCPTCNSSVTEKEVEILWTANQSINLEIVCPECNCSVVESILEDLAQTMEWRHDDFTCNNLSSLLLTNRDS